MEIRIRVPQISAGSISNLVGLAGLLAVVLAVGALAGSWWWSLLAGGIVAVGLAALAQAQDAAKAPAATVVAAGAARPSLVEDAAA